jgi:hypothetical protein
LSGLDKFVPIEWGSVVPTLVGLLTRDKTKAAVAIIKESITKNFFISLFSVISGLE